MIGTREEYLAARRELLAQEKAHTRRSDELAQQRQELPWVPVDEDSYEFETPDGAGRLGDLFAGRSQLLVYHLMFGPDDEAACPGCSFTADSLAGAVVHLENRDVSFVAVSRAPLERLLAYRERMGWSFPWVSSPGTFNADFAGYGDFGMEGIEVHGLSAFAKEDGTVFHTYSAFDRGTDILCSSWQLLDRAPKGRGGELGDWPRRHDEYEEAVHVG
ncbi:MAG TPA: DUF899 domain-containing protein [Thermoleophilaceae bacterium]|nr:DUF899 domain-containing protein [Thermoleophilaceae bacterium]